MTSDTHFKGGSTKRPNVEELLWCMCWRCDNLDSELIEPVQEDLQDQEPYHNKDKRPPYKYVHHHLCIPKALYPLGHKPLLTTHQYEILQPYVQ